MTGNDADYAEGGLHTFEEGDVLDVSDRETPMEVVEKEQTPSGRGINIVAENRYGTYQLTEYEGEDVVLLRVGGDLLLEGTVEVTKID